MKNTLPKMKRYIFFDAMVWIEMVNDEKIHQKIMRWCESNEYTIFVHDFLIFELFNPCYKYQLDKIWDIISVHFFTNLNPQDLFIEEINLFYLYGNVSCDMVLNNKIKRLSTHEKTHYRGKLNFSYDDYLSLKEKILGYETFIKLTYHHDDSQLNRGYVKDLLKDLQISNKNKLASIKPFDTFNHDIVNKKHRNEKSDEITNAIIDEINETNDADELYREILKFIDFYYISFDECMELPLTAYYNKIEFMHIVREAFLHFKYPIQQAEDFMNCIFYADLSVFKSFYTYKIISDSVRYSNAKVKRSDTIDFFNLAYLPYCSLYVTDSLINDCINRNTNYKSTSYKLLKKIIA